jgi:2-haloacid dehalogenase
MASPQIDAVAFDLGGVLLDWNPRHLYRTVFSDSAEMEDFLARICTLDWHRKHDLGADMTQSCRLLAAQHPGYRDQIMAWAERNEEMAAGPIEPTVRVLADLKAAGVRCFSLSNMEPDAWARRCQRFEFMTWFDGHVISGVEHLAKPGPEIFRLLLDRYELEPGRTAFVDDSPANVEAARALGIHALPYAGAGRLRRDLADLGAPGAS